MVILDHKKWVKDIFDKTAATYGNHGCSYFDVFGKSLVDKTLVASGERILDVGMGKGAILFPAAQAVGERGLAVGVDISPEMIAECKKRTIPTWTQLQVMDGENLTFSDNYFDVVFCGFTLFFLPDLHQALTEFKRVLKPQGRLAISVWGNTSRLTQWFVEQSKKYGALKSLKTCTINTIEVLKKTLQDAGFNNVELSEETVTFWHNHAQAWWESLSSHALRSLLEQLSASNLASLHQDSIEYANTISESGRIPEPMHAIYAIGKV